MADSVYGAGVAVQRAAAAERPRHTVLVRATHWLNALSFGGLVVSGAGIVLAHPRFYWGETGGVGGPSLFDLPLPTMLGGPSGWGRYLHFQSAWLCVLTGIVYVASGIVSSHFRRNLAPGRGEAAWGSEDPWSYNRAQRIAYLGVIFAMFPLMIWTGLAMSPALTSVWPWLVTSLGGHQSARTIHFFAAIVLVVFTIGHVVMVWRAGFRRRTAAMITGRMEG